MTYLEYRRLVTIINVDYHAEVSMLDTRSARYLTDKAALLAAKRDKLVELNDDYRYATAQREEARGTAETELRAILTGWIARYGEGAARRYFLLPGHPIPEISRAAGLGGVSLTTAQLRTLFAPHLPSIPRGRNMVKPDIVAIIAGWI